MRDIMQIDWNAPYSKRVAAEPAKQKVFYIQDGIEYDSAGKACNAKQVKAHYEKLARDAQAVADEAAEAAKAAQETANTALKQAGTTRAAARKKA